MYPRIYGIGHKFIIISFGATKSLEPAISSGPGPGVAVTVAVSCGGVAQINLAKKKNKMMMMMMICILVALAWPGWLKTFAASRKSRETRDESKSRQKLNVPACWQVGLRYKLLPDADRKLPIFNRFLPAG